MTVFYTWQFPATGAPVGIKRTMPDRLSDIVNVKDWGAVGNGSGDDTTAIQNAIDFCVGRGGGIVFFPTGKYPHTNSFACGHNSDPDIGVILMGSGKYATVFQPSNQGSWTYPVAFSKGGYTYDCIERIEGMYQINATLTRDGVQVDECFMSTLDVSAASRAMVRNVIFAGSGNPTNDPAPGPIAGLVGLYLGNGLAVNCRGNFFDTLYALSGEGACLLACSGENNKCYARIGWGILTSNPWDSTITYNANDQASYGATAYLSITDGNTNNRPDLSPTDWRSVGTVGQAGEVPAIGAFIHGTQTEATCIGIEAYNATSCSVSDSVLTAPQSFLTSLGVGPITAMSWDNGTHVVTVTTQGSHYIGVQTLNPLIGGVYRIQLYWPWFQTLGNLAWLDPNGWGAGSDFTGWTDATVIDGTHFSYPGPSSDPGAFNLSAGGSIPAGVGGAWVHYNQFGLRIRRAHECLFQNVSMSAGVTIASLDLDYNGEADHKNNTMTNCTANPTGIRMPTKRYNLAGWKFTNTVCEFSGDVHNGMGHWNDNIKMPDGTMNFTDLPGQTGPDGLVIQELFEGQEYVIIDGAKFGGGAAVWGDQVQGSGAGNYKVRYDGSVWRRIG